MRDADQEELDAGKCPDEQVGLDVLTERLSRYTYQVLTPLRSNRTQPRASKAERQHEINCVVAESRLLKPQPQLPQVSREPLLHKTRLHVLAF